MGLTNRMNDTTNITAGTVTAVKIGAVILSAFFGYVKVIVFDNINMFFAIFFVVLFDFFFGVWKAIKFKRFQVRKALKIVYYLTSFWMILFVVLSIEKAHPAAFWLSEAVFLPIIIFQLISALKNASIVGAIPQGLLLKVLESIDKHKDRVLDGASNAIDEVQNDNNNA